MTVVEGFRAAAPREVAMDTAAKPPMLFRPSESAAAARSPEP